MGELKHTTVLGEAGEIGFLGPGYEQGAGPALGPLGMGWRTGTGPTGEAGKTCVVARTEGTRWVQNRGSEARLGTDKQGGRARAISRGLASNWGDRALYR